MQELQIVQTIWPLHDLSTFELHSNSKLENEWNLQIFHNTWHCKMKYTCLQCAHLPQLPRKLAIILIKSKHGQVGKFPNSRFVLFNGSGQSRDNFVNLPIPEWWDLHGRQDTNLYRMTNFPHVLLLSWKLNSCRSPYYFSSSNLFFWQLLGVLGWL